MIRISCCLFFYVMLLLSGGSAIAQSQTGQAITDKQYHEQIDRLWNQKKAAYYEMIKKSGETPYHLYNIQAETNSLLKYAGYCQKYSLVDELSHLYLQALDTLTETDQYLFDYYPGGSRSSVRQLDKKYRMWVNNKKSGIGESILVSSQFLYVLSDTINIITDIIKEKRTPLMNEALNKFIPLLIEHYSRWIFSTPGPFQVRGWGCRFNGKYVTAGMSHLEFLNNKLEKKLGNNESPAYCNAVEDTDLWIIAGVANILTVYQKDKALVPITPIEYKKLLSYFKTSVNLLESRFSYTELKDFDGKSVVGAVFDAGVWDRHPDFAFTGYNGRDYPTIYTTDELKYRGKGVGWDLSHARRFVYVFETLLKAKDFLGIDFPTNKILDKMTNQILYAVFNRDFNMPLFTNFMDGTNGWYRVGYSGRAGFGYGPWDMSVSILVGGYGFWSRYNADMRKVFNALMNMLKSDDPEIRKHVVEHYETSHWDQHKRIRRNDFKRHDNSNTQSLLIQYLPSICFMKRS